MRKKQTVSKEEAILLLQSQPLSAHLWQIASDHLKENALRFPDPAYLDSKNWPDYFSTGSLPPNEQLKQPDLETAAEIKTMEADSVKEKNAEFPIEELAELQIANQAIEHLEVRNIVEEEKSREEVTGKVPEVQVKRKYKKQSEIIQEPSVSGEIENEFQTLNSKVLKMDNPTSQSLDFYEWLEELKEINPGENEISPKIKKLKSEKPKGRVTKAAQELMDAKTMAENSLTLGEEIVSETLARLLARQGHKEEAIEMYEKLIVKYPEKGATFAAALQKLKS